MGRFEVRVPSSIAIAGLGLGLTGVVAPDPREELPFSFRKGFLKARRTDLALPRGKGGEDAGRMGTASSMSERPLVSVDGPAGRLFCTA